MAARKRAEERKLSYLAVIMPSGPGYMALCPSLTGVYGRGMSPQQALDDLRTHTERELKRLVERGDPLPEELMVSLAVLEVSA